jgi:DNA (cytosine-5)-methyltransferase 1
MINNPGIEKDRILSRKIERIDNNNVKKIVGDDRVDVLAAGVPCQGFSIVGYRTKPNLRKENGYKPHKDEKNLLFKQLLRFVRLLEPEFILMENVMGIDRIKVRYRGMNDPVIDLVHKSIENMGYSVSILKIDAKDFGIPQNRKRIFCIARKSKPLPENIKEKLLEAARELGFGDRIENLGNAIRGLPPLGVDDGMEIFPWNNNAKPDGSYYLDYVVRPAKILYNYTTRFHNDDDMKIINEIRQGETYTQLVARAPGVLEGRDMKTYRDDNFPDKFYRLRYDFPSRTIVAHLSKDGNSFIHPEQNRSLTVREAARIQTFPDDFVFSGSRTSQFIQVGNAVPPLLAKVFARFFRKMKEE